jgi:hypothetical protein
MSAAMTGLKATLDCYPVTRVLHLGVAMAGISTSQGVLLSAGVTQTKGSAQPGAGMSHEHARIAWAMCAGHVSNCLRESCLDRCCFC